MGKALQSTADSVSIDLEDAVPESGKDEARTLTAAFLRKLLETDKDIVVRVNALETGRMVSDILAVSAARPRTINVPKCESPRALHVADAVLAHVEREQGLPPGSIGLMATVETPAGLRNAHAIASACARVDSLQLGLGDLRASTGIQPRTDRLVAVRTLIILAAAEAGIDALDSAFVDIADMEGFERDAVEARALGFAGKSCIHPRQVECCNAVFAVSETEREEARELLAAFEEAKARGIGAIMFRGRLVDNVHATEARRLLEASA
jgi:citrate lyase subunit beta/citryl-CoA lyase